MRLDRFLVQSNICSRSEAKVYIRKGRVSVNGSVCKDSALHVDENGDEISVDGQKISYEKNRYYMLNKPAGCVSAVKDGLSDTVIDILKAEPIGDLFPVGRLDKDTEGLLLITNDGDLAHRLLSPKHHVDKTYLVKSDKALSDEEIRDMEAGLDIGDEKLTLPASLKELSLEENMYELTIHEGRFHQVKRMFEACGAKVLYLKRLSMGPLRLDEGLEPGQYRKLSAEEIEILVNVK